MSFWPLAKLKLEDPDDIPPEAKPKLECRYCGNLFRRWILPASGQEAVACPYCTIIAVHLFNKQPMPEWLMDYRTKHELSEREYGEAVRHLQNMLRDALPPQPARKQIGDSHGRMIRDEE